MSITWNHVLPRDYRGDEYEYGAYKPHDADAQLLSLEEFISVKELVNTKHPSQQS